MAQFELYILGMTMNTLGLQDRCFTGRFKKSIGSEIWDWPLGGERSWRGSNCFPSTAKVSAKEQKSTFVVYTIPSLFRRPKLMYICDKTIIISLL